MHKNKLLLLVIIFSNTSLFGMQTPNSLTTHDPETTEKQIVKANIYLAGNDQSLLQDRPMPVVEQFSLRTLKQHPAIAYLLNTIRTPRCIKQRYTQMCRQMRCVLPLYREIPAVAEHCNLVLQLMGKECIRDGGQLGVMVLQKMISAGKMPQYWMQQKALQNKLAESYVPQIKPIKLKKTLFVTQQEISKIRLNCKSSLGNDTLSIKQEN